ncbi:hypothetical protein DRJ12_03870 [Candidatus Acetothermia bacterium]|nr:MAG: hypothetical protein DRJ12_03870 [Candidatus Acetothermia bacterium]
MRNQNDELVRKKDLEEVEERLAAKIDGVDQRLSAKIDDGDKRLTKKIDDVDKRLSAKIDANAAKIDANAGKIDANAEMIKANGKKIEANAAAIHNLTREVVDIRIRLDQTLTRDEFKVYFDEIITGQDKMMSVLTRLDQDWISILSRIERLERDVARLKADKAG